jgi:hypothetical protein
MKIVEFLFINENQLIYLIYDRIHFGMSSFQTPYLLPEKEVWLKKLSKNCKFEWLRINRM